MDRGRGDFAALESDSDIYTAEYTFYTFDQTYNMVPYPHVDNAVTAVVFGCLIYFHYVNQTVQTLVYKVVAPRDQTHHLTACTFV